ncbi:16S rRNA (uracil(1498)-N(3))-methyltransferase [Psychrobacter sp.]|uniref:16S rRNA (uracil(1498)-N(3))-methyltransferase n=1 Tax=Psychrobacter sp. TaxID=56811 RepID=UPI002649BCE8|nr:16S rRNA (uracil(1498)-N(3))-methyltransferase [Psychrobacter sp.]MDN6276115.1 16S rRNA (uracil(1498)-N(3))-methyltransferase [Psychrobacter sp.]MDN6308949.1 16S rRNA (uracil(1498)-N(3))-methyltransferase [Psychrobacter sp.]
MNCILLPTDKFSLDGARIEDSAQISHITKVLSAKVGDRLKIGELGGCLGTGIIGSISADVIQLHDVELATSPPPKMDLTVVLALPRPKVLRRLIMDMTALGVRDIVLINSYRTQKSYWQSPMLERLDEFVLEGLQQGVDTVAPRITLQKRFKPFVEDNLADYIANRAIVAHPYSEQPFSQYLQQQPSILPSLVCIGSEGGWIDYEVALLAKQGCEAVSIGPRILRTEAAVNAILGRWLL